MRRRSVLAKVAVLGGVVSMSVLGTGVAMATPPTGVVQFTDLARAQAVEGASVPIKPGSALVTGAYSLAPGGQTGWRKLPGAAILAVTKGKMTVRRADGCGTKDYAAGQASVVPTGEYLIENPGKEPLELFGVFFDQPADAPKPLAEGPTATAPANCSAFTAASAPSGVSVTRHEAATMVPGMFGNGSTLDIEAGKDVYASFLDISPGFSSGWISHRPAVNIMSGGELSYVMARDGKCDTSEKYHTGQAFYHPAHRHMANNEGKDHVLLTSMYFDLPHDTAAPVIGDTITAVDFTQAPPADCLRLR
jgi:mannose-6-phosphate isomerase-like protein (cupin superfamily)